MLSLESALSSAEAAAIENLNAKTTMEQNTTTTKWTVATKQNKTVAK